MGIKEIWASMIGAVDTEYDRRIKAASNVRDYNIGGHGHGHDHGHADHTDEHGGHGLNHVAEAADDATIHPGGQTEHHAPVAHH